jgi:hypothetical protein
MARAYEPFVGFAAKRLILQIAATAPSSAFRFT